MLKKQEAKPMPSKLAIMRICGFFVCIGLLGVFARLHEGSRADLLAEETGTGSTVTGTGSSTEISAEEAAVQAWEEKKTQSENFRKAYTSYRQLADSLQKQKANIESRQDAYRIECAEDLRTASKFTQLSTALRCYRTELNIQLDILSKERDVFAQTAGITEELQTKALSAIDALMDAIVTVIGAIDSNVYGSLRDMEETKQNLQTVYREPKWLKEQQMKAQQLLSWSAALSVRTAVLMEQYKESDPTIQEKLFQGLLCMEEGDSILETVLSAESYKNAENIMDAYAVHFESCTGLLEEAQQIYMEVYTEEEIDEEEVQDPYVSRRVRRRQGE